MTAPSGLVYRHDGVRSGYLGLQLTAGALALIGATWLFGGVAEDVVHSDPLILVEVGFRAGRSHTWMTGTGILEPSLVKTGTTPVAAIRTAVQLAAYLNQMTALLR